ncbi:MAG: hypothetical protein WC384_00270 [Prolixibacteraceae bacterium]|jgi:hypothetical protein
MYEEDKTEPDFMNRNRENPFQTPDHYFDSLEDRIMGRIEHSTKKKTSASRVYLMLKPALGLAASFALVYLLVYYPINTFLLKDNVIKTEVAGITKPDPLDGYSLNFSLIDENSLVNAIFADDATSAPEINPDEVLAYLTTGSNDIEIYSAIQN